jgi:hypothetical protein
MRIFTGSVEEWKSEIATAVEVIIEETLPAVMETFSFFFCEWY